jgi:hypothetical protein
VSVEFETVEEFLEHHGTKGMRWGVRTGGSGSGGSGSRPRSNPPNRSSGGKFVSKQEQHKGLTSGQKTALVVGGAVAAALITRLLLKHRQTTLKTMRATEFTKGISSAQAFAKTIGKTNMSTVKTPIVSGMNPFKTPAGLFGKI